MQLQQKIDMAVGYFNTGKEREGISLLFQVLEEDQENTEANYALAEYYRRLGRDDMSIPLLERALKSDSRNVKVHLSLARALYSVGRVEDASVCLEKVADLGAADYNNLFLIANVCKDLALLELAESIYIAARSLDENRYEAHVNLAILHKDLGDLDRSEKGLDRALEIQPDCAEALFTKAFMKEQHTESSLLNTMELLYELRDQLSPRQRMFLAYGLGKAYEDTGAFDKAFEFMKEGNQYEARIKRVNMDKELDASLFSRIKSVFSQDNVDKFVDSGSAENRPIFIVGMPRSGTTLVEQILASHSSVYGAGELEDFQTYSLIISSMTQKPFPEGIGRVGREALAAMASQYLNKVEKLSGRDGRFTDKMPNNFLYIGLILLVFPNAKIIHCQREPLDTCLSIFKNSLKGNFPYSHDLTTLGKYYREYQNLMTHWHKVFPYKIYDVTYENLVVNTEEEIRYLLNFCQLGFEENCLNFYQNNRPVLTASATQVRRPISMKSVSGWKRYEKQLSPLRLAME